MKAILIAFHLFMVMIYLAMGGILIFTQIFPVISGTTRVLLGLLLFAYAGYRGYAMYRNVIQRPNGN